MEDETNVRLLRDDNADDIEGNGGVSYGSPSFVSQSEALQYQMARVEVKVDQLHEMHLKHLRRPTLDEESQEESNIKRLTNEITQVSTVDSGNSKRLHSEQSLISKHYCLVTLIVL